VRKTGPNYCRKLVGVRRESIATLSLTTVCFGAAAAELADASLPSSTIGGSRPEAVGRLQRTLDSVRDQMKFLHSKFVRWTVTALFIGLFIFGMIQFPDAPLQPCGLE